MNQRRMFGRLSAAVALLACAGCVTDDPHSAARRTNWMSSPAGKADRGEDDAGFETTVRGQDVGPNGYARQPFTPSTANQQPTAANGYSQTEYPRSWSTSANTNNQPPPGSAYTAPNGAPGGTSGPAYTAPNYAPGSAPPGSTYAAPNGAPNYAPGAPAAGQLPSPGATVPGSGPFGGAPPWGAPPPGPNENLGLPPNFADIDAFVEEARSGRLMFGVGVNSSAGVTGQIVVDERNFDIMRPPTSWSDFANGTAWRGAGQGFRLEALPGNQVQRYMVSFTEPYLLDSQISMSLSGFYYSRNFFDWNEQRYGGRLAFGYRLTHDLSLSVSGRAENIKVLNPRVPGVPELDAVVGESVLYVGQVKLTHDTRDLPFAPTEGHLIDLSFQQGFGTFDYPRGDVTYSQYFLVRERADGSGRHTFSYNARAGVTGSQTPIFENYFAGGFSTLRGFDFRGASPVVNTVIVGGKFQFLGSVEYMFPLTHDDMIKGVLFCDFGTVEKQIAMHAENFRVAPGFGVRISIPALGPAPLALDMAFPVAHASTDDIQNFSFFFGLGRF